MNITSQAVADDVMNISSNSTSFFPAPDISNLKIGRIPGQNTITANFNYSKLDFPLKLIANFEESRTTWFPQFVIPHCIARIEGVERLYVKEDGTYENCPRYPITHKIVLKMLEAPVSSLTMVLLNALFTM